MALPTEYDGINRWNIFTDTTKTTGDLTIDFAITNTPVSVRNDSSFVQDSNTNHKGKKFEYYGQEYYIVDGQVIVENKPVPNVMVSAESKVYGYYESRGQCVTDENGYYKLTYNEYNQPDNFRLMVEVATKDKKYNTQVKDFVKPRLESNVFTTTYKKGITPDMIPYMQSLKTPYFNYANYGSITSTFTENAAFPYKNMVNGNDYSDFGTGRQEVIIDMNTLSRLNYFKIGLVSSVSPAVEMWYSYSLDVAFTKFYDSTETAIPNDKVIEIKMTDTSINTHYVKIILNGTQNKIDFLMATFRNEFTNKDYLVYNNDTQIINFRNVPLTAIDNVLTWGNGASSEYRSIGFKDASRNNGVFSADFKMPDWGGVNRFGMSIRQTKARLNTTNNTSQTFLFSETDFWLMNYYTGNQNIHVAQKPHFMYRGWNNIKIEAYKAAQVYSINGKYLIADTYFRNQTDTGTMGFCTYNSYSNANFKARNIKGDDLNPTEFFNHIIEFKTQADIDQWIEAINCDVKIENDYMLVSKTINHRPILRIKGITAKNFLAEVEMSMPATSGDNAGFIYNTTAFSETGLGYAYIVYINGNTIGGGSQSNDVNKPDEWNALGSGSISGSTWETLFVSRSDEYHTGSIDNKNTYRFWDNKHKNGGYFGFSGYLPSQSSFKVKSVKIKIIDEREPSIGEDLITNKNIDYWAVNNGTVMNNVVYENGVTTFTMPSLSGFYEKMFHPTKAVVGGVYKLSGSVQFMSSTSTGSWIVGITKAIPDGDYQETASDYYAMKTTPVVTSTTPTDPTPFEFTFTSENNVIYPVFNFSRVADNRTSDIKIINPKLERVS